MIEDMTVRGFGEKTQNDYIRHVKNFTIFLGRSPDTAEGEDLRAFQLHQRENRVQPPTMNSTVAALRFFFTTTCDRPEMARHLRLVKQPQKLPVVLTTEEVLLLLEAAPGPKYKAALGVAYGAGLRVSEVANLKVSDIDSERMVLRVEQGKGCKDRNGMLSPRLLELLRGVVVGRTADDVAVSRPRSAAADHDAPALSRGLRHGGRRRHREAGLSAHAAAQLCHPPSGAGCRYSRDPGGSRTFQARHDGALCPRGEQGAARCDEPARSTDAAHPQEGHDRSNRRRTWLVQPWRSRISSATTVLLGGTPTGAISAIGQLKVMSAIEGCRTAALGGHVARCENAACGHTAIAYNSCLMGRSSNGELAAS